MLRHLKDFFSSLESGATEDHEYQQHLAIAIVLLEVAHADHELHETELEHLLELLVQHWRLDGEEARALLQEAQQVVKEEVSLHQHLHVLKTRLGMQQRTVLVEQLWGIACADDQIHHWEEHLIRRLADMLGVGHQGFIRGKHNAVAGRSGPD